MEENKYYKQAREELAYLSGDPYFQRAVEDRAGFLMDQECYKRQIRNEALAKGEKIGEERGKIEGKLNLAKKLKSKNMPIDEIIELTGLTEDEILKL